LDCKIVKLIFSIRIPLILKKGSGFYVNDYPSKSRKEATKSEKEASEKPVSVKQEDKKAEKKADAK